MLKKTLFFLFSLSLLTAKAQEYQLFPHQHFFMEFLQHSPQQIKNNHITTIDIFTINYNNGKEDTADSYYKINFDENGNLILWLYYYKNNLKKFGHYQYNKKNQVTLALQSNDFKKWYYAEYEYNDFDSLQKVTVYNETKTIFSELSCAYNKQHQLTSQQWTKPLLQLPVSEKYEYNRMQQISKITIVEADSTLVQKHFTWQNKKMLTEKHFQDGHCFLIIDYSYNENDKLILKKEQHLDNKVEVIFDYKYENNVLTSFCESHYGTCKKMQYKNDLLAEFIQFNQAQKPMFKRIYRYNTK